MDETTRQALSQALLSADKLAADIVLRKTARLSIVPTSFFKNWQIIQVDYFSPTKPIMFYVAALLPEKALLLTNHPESFTQIALQDAKAIDRPEMAIEYVLTFLEVTRATQQLHYIITSVKDIKFLPNPSATQSAQIAQIQQKYQTIITAPLAQLTTNDILVTCSAILGRDLIQHQITVTAKGELTVDGKKLESNLPVRYSVG